MAEPPERTEARDPRAELAALRRDLDAERARREASDAENARLQAQIESYAEDLGSLYQERHGRGRGGLSAELSNLRAELADESARGEVLGELYQRSRQEARTLGDQLVSYGQDLARAYRTGKRAGGGPGPATAWQRAGAAALALAMVGTMAASLWLGAPQSSTAQPSPTPAAAVEENPTPGEIRVVSSDGERPDLDAAIAAAAAAGTAAAAAGDDGARTATAVAAQVDASAGTATALADLAASSAATAAAAGTAAAVAAGTATASVDGAALVAGAFATATAATGAARTAVAVAADARATATVAVAQAATALAGASARAGTATAAARFASAAPATPVPGTPTPAPQPTPLALPAATPGPDLGPTVTALAGAVDRIAAEGTVGAATATVFAREAGDVAATATSLALTATAPTETPTAEARARRGPPGALGDLERCSWEVPIPPIGPGRGYHVHFAQASRASITVLWSHGEGAMVLESSGGGAVAEWRPVAEAERADVVAPALPPGAYRVRLENLGAAPSAETMVALFYDELALCTEPAGSPDDSPAAAVKPDPGPVAVVGGPAPRPFLDCRPHVRAPYGFVQVQPRLWVDRSRRVEGTMAVTILLKGPGTDMALELVAGPGRRAERIPLFQPGRYELSAVAEGADLHENCTQGFWFERTEPGLPTLPAPADG